jgi:hypothetical protein
MSENDSAHDEAETEGRSSQSNFLLRQLPYIAALVLAVAGVAYTNLSQQPLVGYWEFLAVAVGVVCIVTQWEFAPDKSARFRLIWTQAIHWAAVLVAMNIMMLSRVQSILPAQAISLVLLIILALGTFLAGVGFLSLQICFLGLAMALAVPAIAWLTQSFLFLVLAAALVIGLGVAFWPSRGKRRAAKSEGEGNYLP